MNPKNIINMAAVVILASAGLSFAGNPASSGSMQMSQQSCYCPCAGAVQDHNNAGIPSATKRPVDEVNWDEVFGVTG